MRAEVAPIPLAAPVIFAGQPESVNVSAGVDRDLPGQPLWFSEATGFYDQSHLTRHFKRLVGVTPGRYRGSSRMSSRVSSR